MNLRFCLRVTSKRYKPQGADVQTLIIWWKDFGQHQIQEPVGRLGHLSSDCVRSEASGSRAETRIRVKEACV